MDMACGWLTRISVKLIAVSFMFSLCEACSFSVMLGYMTDLLHRFGTPWTDVGIYQGQIVGLNSLAYGLSNFAAGFFIDRMGSVKFLLISTVLQIIVAVFAVFIHNMTWMYITAFLTGLASCNHLALNVIVCEISDESNVSEITIYGLKVPGSFGTLIGPSMGGFLALPTVQYNNIFSNSYLLDVFPVMLPHLLIASILLITLIASWKFWVNEQKSNSESEILLNEDNSTNKQTGIKHNPKNVRWSWEKAFEFMRRKNVLALLWIGMLLRVISKPSINVFSIWILTPRSEGGMGFSPMKNGQLKLYASLILPWNW